MDAALLVLDLKKDFGWELTANALEDQVSALINTMIQRDFGTLVQLLYRIDVSETRLRGMLEASGGEDAGRLIARLIMERQWQKIESRQRYRQDNAGPDEDTGVERW